ncbi:MAG: repair protein recO [Firmicutes bacterium]|nr:repair protein recO [Bacillota bacterium]
MGQYKTEAILLVVRDWDDSSRVVTLFSREFGKITAIGYGARRPRNQLAGTLQPFVQTELVLLSGKSYDSIKQCEIIESFRGIREDLSKMAYANFLAELVVELWPERVAEAAVYDMLLAAFTMMKTRNPRITSLASALQLLNLAGFSPEITKCSACGDVISGPAFFCAAIGGAICPNCSKPGFSDFSEETGVFFKRLMELDWQEPGSFTVTGAILLETERLLADFITYCLDKQLKSIAFIAAVT